MWCLCHKYFRSMPYDNTLWQHQQVWPGCCCKQQAARSTWQWVSPLFPIQGKTVQGSRGRWRGVEQDEMRRMGDEYGKEGGIGSGRGKVWWHGTHQTFHSQDWSTFTSQCRFVPGKIVAITVAINFATNNMSELAHDGSMGLIWRKEIMFPYKKEASRCQNSPARQHIVTIALLTAHGTR